MEQTSGTLTHAKFEDLPADVLILIFEYLGIDVLAKLSRTCRAIKQVVDSLGWETYLHLHSEPAPSLTPTLPYWSARKRVRYDALTAQAWSNRAFVARPLCKPWKEKYQPVLALSSERLVVGVGNRIISYAFGYHDSRSHGALAESQGGPIVRQEGTYIIRRKEGGGVSSLDSKTDARLDIRSLVFVPSPDGSMGRTLCVGFADGVLVKISLPCKQTAEEVFLVVDDCMIDGMFNPDDAVLALSCSNNMLLSLTASGKARLTNLHTLQSNSTSSGIAAGSYAYSPIDLQTRGWSTLLTPSYAIFGCSSMETPLVLHSITESGLSSSPTHILGTQRSYLNSLLHPMHLSEATLSAQVARNLRSTAVYGLCAPPPSFPSGSLPGQVVISGWFDGFVRIYDLRTSKRTVSRASLEEESTTPHLAPVLSLSDPWSQEPIYAVAAGGSSGSHITAGSARHSVMAFWDVRSPASPQRDIAINSLPRNDSRAKSDVVTSGWSVHGPGNDSSPVYDVAMESSRVWGVTQSRAFVYDFGPDVGRETYPTLDSDILLGPSDPDMHSHDIGSDGGNWRHRDVQSDASMIGVGTHRRGGLGRREHAAMRGLGVQNFDGLKGAGDGVGYYVTVYKHSSGMHV